MNKWPKERTAELESRREGGETVKSIACELGVSEQMASYHLKHVKPLDDMIDALPDYPGELLQLPDAPCALTADWHAPYYSKKWLKRLLAVCKVLGVKNLAVVGDLTDFSWISRFLRKDSRGGGLAGDIDITLTLLDRLLVNFEHVYWNHGNHEERLAVALHGQDPLFTIAQHGTRHGNGELHMSVSRTMLLGDDWRLEHPKTFNRDAAKIAAAAGAIYHKNIACGHCHRFGFKYDVSGEYIGIDLGGLFDINKQEYLANTGITDLPTWNPGFWVYGAGKVRPFADAFVNWKDFNVE